MLKWEFINQEISLWSLPEKAALLNIVICSLVKKTKPHHVWLSYKDCVFCWGGGRGGNISSHSFMPKIYSSFLANICIVKLSIGPIIELILRGKPLILGSITSTVQETRNCISTQKSPLRTFTVHLYQGMITLGRDHGVITFVKLPGIYCKLGKKNEVLSA